MAQTEAASEPAQAEAAGFWSRLREAVSLADYRPRPAPGTAVREQEGAYILKSPQADNYLQLSAHEFALWNRMDGRRTVRELAVEYFIAEHHFIPIAEFVRRLRSQGFLADPPTKLRKQLQEAVQRQQEPWGRRLLELLWGRPLPIRGADRFYRLLYRLGGRLLFARPALVVQALVILAGLATYLVLLAQGRQGYEILKVGHSYLLGLGLLLLLNVVTLGMHEVAHALATIHEGCEVRRSGFMLYLGMPALYVDTTDTWMAGKKGRIRVAAAGPWNDLLLGGLCALLAFPAWPAGPFFLKVATLSFIGALFNLSPLLELDGYYILSDLLDMPYLRRDALAFMVGGLWPRLHRRQRLTRNERLYAGYGLLAVFYAVLVGGIVALFWRSQVTHLLQDMAGWGRWGKLAIAALAAAVGLPLAILLFRRAYRQIERGWRFLAERGFLARTLVRVLIVAALSLALALLPWLLPPAWLQAGMPFLPPLLYALAALLLAGLLPLYRGTPFRRVLVAIAATALLLGTGSALDAGQGLAAGDALARAAQLGALLAALVAFSSEDMLRSRLAERAVMVLLLGGGFVLALLLSRGVPLDRPFTSVLATAAPAFLGGAALALLVPTVVSFAGTPFFPPWLLFVVALALGLARAAARPAPLPAFQLDLGAAWLLAAGAALYRLAQHYMVYTGQLWSNQRAGSARACLQQAFAHLFAALFAIFRATFGRRRAQVLDDQLDIIAVTADWLVAVNGGRIQETSATENLPLEQLSDQYVELLDRTMGLMARLAGQPFLQRALQAAYDGLPWAEQEVLARRVLEQTAWGEAVSRRFVSRQDEELHLLAGVPLFWGCDRETLAELHEALHQERVPAGHTLFRHGEAGSDLYIVASGKVEVWQSEPGGRELKVGDLHHGDFFGQEAAPAGGTVMTYRASVETELLRIEGTAAERFWKDRPQPSEQVRARARLFSRLVQLDLFQGLPWHELQALAAHMERRRLPAEHVLIQEGQPADTFYLIEQGHALAISGRGSAAESVRQELGPGEYMGETNPFLTGASMVTVVTAEPCTLWALPAREFARFLEKELLKAE